MRTFFSLLIFFFGVYTEGGAQNPSDAYADSLFVEDLEISDTSEMNLDEIPPVFRRNDNESIQKYYREDIQPKDFDTNDWKKATKDLDYTIEKEEEKPRSKKSPSFNLTPFWFSFIKWFFIIGGVAILAFILLKFLGEGNVFGRQSRRVYAPSVGIDLERIEENLQNAEFDALIQQAISKKQFTLAIRLYYLAIIKELNITGAIKWKKDKTNSTYIREMRPHKLFDSFRHITSIFERVWYGDTAFGEADFYSIQPTFQDVLKEAKKS